MSNTVPKKPIEVKKTSQILLLTGVLALLVMYNKEIFFHFQYYKLRKHIEKVAVVNNDQTFSHKAAFFASGNYSKVWAHRVNTLNRYKFLLNYFQGFEMDIVFDEQGHFLDVRHPPATSIHLSFEKYLQIKESTSKFFWLDIKNLDSHNQPYVLEILNKLDGRFKIRSRIIVESNDIPSLSRLADAGYFTSYYYDKDSFREFMNQGSQPFRDSTMSNIGAVSGDVLIYDSLQHLFPDKLKLTWALSIKNYFSDSLFNALDNDKKLLVYLVNIKSAGYR